MNPFTRWAVMFFAAILAVLVTGTPGFALDAPESAIGMSLMFIGATQGVNVLTLHDWAKRLDPDGKVPQIVEMLAMTNEILADMLWVEGNLPTGHRVTMRTGLPRVYWRLINQGTPSSKSATAQVDEHAGMLEAWAEVDVELARLNRNVNAFRFSEAQAFIESMNQEMASTVFYGNAGVSPEEFNGLSVRYSDPTTPNGRNIIDGGGTGSDNTSIWLVVWGQNTVHGLFPKGSKAGLEHVDHGEQTIETANGIGGTRLRVYQDQWTWKVGMALKDWRYVVRIANIDVSDLAAEGEDAANLTKLMTKALWRIPSFGMGRAAFYVNRTVGQYLDIQRQERVQLGGQLGYTEVDGKVINSFRNVPIRTCDSLLETEDAVSFPSP